MQKKLIALAVAGLVAAPAFAQVSLSGRADVGFARLTNDKDSKNTIGSGLLTGSRVTLKAEEDLGGGMKALVALEMGVNVDNGNGAGDLGASTVGSTGATDGQKGGLMFNRQSQVGLSGAFGAVMLGRNWTPTHLWGYATALQPQGAANWESGYIFAKSGAAYTNTLSNSIEYTTPKLGPVEARVQYGFAENSKSETEAATALNDKGSLALGARASVGPANLFLGYSKIHTANDATAGTDRDNDVSKQIAFGGNVNLGMVTPFFSYQNNKNTDDNIAAAASVETKQKSMSLGAKVGVGASGNVFAQFATVKQTVDGNDSGKAKGFSLSYEHAFSKRTKTYAAFGNIKNKDVTAGNDVDFHHGYAMTADGKTSKQLALGMVHYF